MAKKAGSDGQIRKTTAEWAADTKTYLEGERLMDTTTGTVRVSKGTTYALAWQPSAGGGASAWGDITGTLSNQLDLNSALETLTNGLGQEVSDRIAEGAALDAEKADAIPTYVARLTQSGTSAPVATVLKNTLGGTVVWTRTNPGDYLATLSGAFPTSDRTIIELDPASALILLSNEAVTASSVWSSTNSVQVAFSDSSDYWLSAWYIKIEIYPAP